MKHTGQSTFIVALLAVLSALSATAQELTVKYFKMAESDLAARQYPRKDANGEACALVKVEVLDIVTNVEGGSVGDIIDKGNEKWVYIIAHQRYFKLHFASHLSVEVNTRDYEINGLVGNTTYVLRLVEDNGGVEPLLSSPIVLPNPVSLPLEMSPRAPALSLLEHASAELIVPTTFVTPPYTAVTSPNTAVTSPNTAVTSPNTASVTTTDATAPPNAVATPSSTAVATPSIVAASPATSLAVNVTIDAEGRWMTFTMGEVAFKMIRLKGGTFVMGSKDGDSDEKPLHEVKLSDFYIGETEVTQALWKAVMGNNPSHFKGDDLPVESVTWNDCQEFISRLNKLTGQTFRLPTEAEWEYAARGGRLRHGDRYSGGGSVYDIAWFSANSNNAPHAVASKKPNDLGLYDMSGNVWEWCSDLYGAYPLKEQTDPTGADYSASRVVRGGSWLSGMNTCRVSYRSSYEPRESYFNLGLRLCHPQYDAKK